MRLYFRRIGILKKSLFTEEIRSKFKFYNAISEVLLNDMKTNSIDVFIQLLVQKKSIKKEYQDLSVADQELARDYIFTLMQFNPESINHSIIKRCLEEETAKGAKEIMSLLPYLKEYANQKKVAIKEVGTLGKKPSKELIKRITAVGSKMITSSLSDARLQKCQILFQN
jgi:hypothetical protein